MSIANDFWHFEIIKMLRKLKFSKGIFCAKHSFQRDADAKITRALDSGWYESYVKCLKSVVHSNRIQHRICYCLQTLHFLCSHLALFTLIKLISFFFATQSRLNITNVEIKFVAWRRWLFKLIVSFIHQGVFIYHWTVLGPQILNTFIQSKFKRFIIS